jgi:DNA-binding transcriptional ArsR family regulator
MKLKRRTDAGSPDDYLAGKRSVEQCCEGALVVDGPKLRIEQFGVPFSQAKRGTVANMSNNTGAVSTNDCLAATFLTNGTEDLALRPQRAVNLYKPDTYIGNMVVTPDREPDAFGAISHPARRRMLDLLVEADRSVSTIAGYFQMGRPAVSQHLRILLDAGPVTEQRHGREQRYRLVPVRLAPVRDWIAHYERFWDHHLQRLQKQLSKRSKE